MASFDHSNECLFCSVEPDLIILQNSLAFVMFDEFPVSQGHSLIIPRRHVADYSDLTANEIQAIHQILAEARPLIQERFSPDGFNIDLVISTHFEGQKMDISPYQNSAQLNGR